MNKFTFVGLFFLYTTVVFAGTSDSEEQCIYKNEQYSNGAIVQVGKDRYIKCVVKKTTGYPAEAMWVAVNQESKKNQILVE